MTDIVVIGGANIDIKAKITGSHHRGSSNPGAVTQTIGGVGRNIAHNLAKRGFDVALISAVGDDNAGQDVLLETGSVGVDVDRVAVLRGAETGTYVAMLDSEGELVSAVSDMRIMEQITFAQIRQHTDVLSACKMIVADCNLPVETLKALAFGYGPKLVIETVSVEKCVKMKEAIAGLQIGLATPNLDQVHKLTGTRTYDEAIAILHQLGLRNVVINLGADGAISSDGQDVDYAAAAPPPKIIDVTGAGDAALTGVIEGLLKSKSLAEAAAMGQQLAGMVIGSRHSTLE